MRLFFAKIYWFLLLILIALGFALLWMVGTQPGSHWLMGKVLERSPDNLTITNYTGTLIRGFSADKLEFKNRGIHLVMDELKGDYSIYSLLKKQINIHQLEAKTVNFIITPKKKDPNKPPALPEFNSPLPVSIGRLAIGELSVALNNKTYLLKDTLSEAELDGDHLALTNLTTQYKSAMIDADISLQFAAPFPIAAQGNIAIPKIFTASDINISGELNQYTLAFTADSNIAKFPPFNGDVEADGNFYGLDNLTANLKLLQGNVLAKGELSWKKGLKTNIRFKGNQIRPENYYEKFPGLLSLQGEYAFQQHKTRLNFKTQGKIRGYPVDLKSILSIADKTVHIDSANAKIGTNFLDLSGDIYPGLIGVLNFKLQAPDLNALHPDIKGQADVTGKMNGDLRKPVFDLQISGNKMQYQEYRSGSYKANFSPGTFRDHYFFDIKANNVATKSIQFKSVNLDGAFSERTQNAKITIDGGKVFEQLTSTIRGSYDKNTAIWNGIVSQLDISEKHLSTYTLKNPASITLSKQRQSLSSMCLGHKKESLCIHGNLALKGASKVELTLMDFPIQRLKFWLPDAGLLKEIINGKSTLIGNNGQWTANTDVGFGLSNKLLSKISLNQDSKDLAGKIEIRFTKLEWINLFTDEIISPRGKLSVDLDVSGKLNQPLIVGQIRLGEGFARIPELGTEFSDIKLDATFDRNKNVALSAEIKSGSGKLGLTGNVNVEQLPQWRAHMTTSGENFEMVNIPVAKVSVSPELIISASNKGIEVRGALNIPDANISLGNLSSIANYPSSDEIIIGKEKKEKTSNLPIDVNIEVRLGKNVNISGFGLTSRLSGGLSLIQKNGKPVEADGSIQLEDGEYKAYGQKLAIERGDIYFNGPLKAPGLNLRATRKIESEDVTAGLKVSGTLQQPTSEVFSIPPLPETDALAYLLTGRPLNGLGEGDSSMLINAAARLGLKSGAGTIDKLRRKAGLDKFAIQAGQDISDSALILGKFLTPKLYIQYVTKLFTESETFSLRYKLSQKLHLEAESDQENQSMDLIYQYER